LKECHSITYAGIMDILEHCKELCYLKLEHMEELTETDINAIRVNIANNAESRTVPLIFDSSRISEPVYHDFHATFDDVVVMANYA
jgi:hypothetical protein